MIKALLPYFSLSLKALYGLLGTLTYAVALAQLLSVADRGIVAYFLSTNLLIASLLIIGIPHAIFFLVSNKTYRLKQTIFFISVISLLTTIIASIGSYYVLRSSSLFNSVHSSLYLYSFSYVFIHQFSTLVVSAVSGYGFVGIGLIINLIKGLLATLAFILYGNFVAFDVSGALFAYFISSLIGLLYLAFYIDRSKLMRGHEKSINFSKMFLSIFSISIRNLGHGFSGAIKSYGATFFVGLLSSPVIIGIFAVIQSVLSAFSSILRPIYTLVSHKMISRTKSYSWNEIPLIITVIAAFISLFLFSYIFPLIMPIVFGENYYASGEIIASFSVFSFIMPFIHLISSLMLSRNWQFLSSLPGINSSILLVLFLIIFLPIYSEQGFKYAYNISALLTLILSIITLRVGQKKYPNY